MTALYWAIARVGEHPSGARSEDWLGSHKLAEDQCEAFPTTVALAKSMRFMEILTDEEDPALHWEVVSFYGDSSSRRTSDLSEGVYVACPREESRSQLIPWLEGLAASSSSDDVAAAQRALRFYRENREAWELE